MRIGMEFACNIVYRRIFMEYSAGYRAYLETIRSYPLLTFEQELELAEKIQAGDAESKLRLIQCNLRLVVSIASRMSCSCLSIMDIIQEGNMGLITAASKYHHSYNVRFSTYAYWWITQSINRYLTNKKRMVRLPHRKEELLRKIKQAQSVLGQRLHRVPSTKETALYLGISEQTVMETENCSFAMLSIDTEIEPDSGQNLGDIIPDFTYAPEKPVMDQALRAEIAKLLDTLPTQERQVIWFRYNLGHDRKPKTLREISSLLGVSAETVRQMELRALKRLRKVCPRTVS